MIEYDGIVRIEINQKYSSSGGRIMKLRIPYLARVLLLSLLLILSGSYKANADEFPSRAIEVIIPYAPGGVMDINTRMMSDELSKALGVPIIPINRAGGGGALGTEYVAKARPDGYTILSGVITLFNLLPFMTSDVNYTLSDFIPLCKHYYSPNLILVRKDSPLKSFEDLVSYAKKNPGKLTCATAGQGTYGHFSLEMLKFHAGVDVAPVHYKSGGEEMTSVLNGQVDLAIISFTPAQGPLKSGQARGLVSISSARVRGFPDLPTLQELGFGKAVLVGWYGYFLPKGTPKSIVDKLSSVFENVIKDPSVRDKVESSGNIVDYQDGPAFEKYILEEHKVLEDVAKKANLKGGASGSK